MIDSVFVTFGCNTMLVQFGAVDLKWLFLRVVLVTLKKWCNSSKKGFKAVCHSHLWDLSKVKNFILLHNLEASL